MRESISKVKGMVAKKDIIPILTYYIIRAGRVYACNDFVTVSAPVQIDFDVAVKAEEFQRFLDKTEGPLKLTLEDNLWIKMSCGRFRAKIPGMDPKLAPVWAPSQGKPVKLPSDLKDKLAAVRPFVSDNATQPWSTFACIHDGYVYASNNITLIRAQLKLSLSQDLMLCGDTLDYILSREEPPTHLVCDADSLTLGWKDKTWLHQRNSEHKFPVLGFKMFESLPEPEWVLTPEWKEAFDLLGDLVEGEITIFEDKIVSSTPNAVIEAEMKSPVLTEQDHTSWNTKYSTDAFKAADKITFFMAGGPRMSFKNDHLEGVCSGMRK